MSKIQGKLLDLQEAVRRYLKPGMSVHLAGGIGGPSAFITEIIRQYWGKNPEFTLIQATVTGHALNLIHSKIAKKLICSVCVDISSSGRPSRVIQNACENGQIDLENWSLLSLQQRLMAGAFGLPFMPTRSVMESTIAEDNKSSFKVVEDPFGSGERIGLASALKPDISFIHGCVADMDGNTIMPVPYGEDQWGALASKGGAVVSVEKIVPPDFIQKFSALVKIPSSSVRAVVAAPMGLHPFSLANPGISDIDPYEKDVDFLNVLHEASLNEHALGGWIKEWVLECPDHEAYLSKLGEQRTVALREKSRGKPARDADTPGENEEQSEFSAREMMLVALAREILASVDEKGHNLILAGAGAAASAAFLAYRRLESSGFELATGNGQVGYTPVPGESILASEQGVRSAKMLTDTVMMQGVLIGGGNNNSLSILGAGQMDKFGNINSTKTSKGKFLVGSGGVNDALNAREAILCLDQSKDRFVDKLAYVTGRGNAVRTVVSTMGIFRKPTPQDELHLVACFPDSHARSLEERVKEIRSHCGWDLKTAPVVAEVPNPSSAELKLLRRLATN